MSDRALPFEAPSRRLAGNEAVAQSHVDAAARLLFVAQQLASTAGVPVYRSAERLEDGTVVEVIVSPHGNSWRVVGATQPQPEDVADRNGDETTANFVWMPTGFVLTPRSAAAPKGYGLPPTEDGAGTPGGPCKEVILSRLRDNAYPDALYQRYYGSVPAGARVTANPVFYPDWQVALDTTWPAGMQRGARGYRMKSVVSPTVNDPQFRQRWDALLAEPDGGQWFCHRPTFAAEGLFQRAVRAATNGYRKAAGMAPLYPPIRGKEGELSALSAYLQYDAHVMAHDSKRFRAGYQTFEDRTRRAGSVTCAGEEQAGENITASRTLPASDTAAGAHAAANWRASPEHYAAMITDWGRSGEAIGTCDAAYLPLDKPGEFIGARQVPPYSIDSSEAAIDPPARGFVATQIFTSERAWVAPAEPVWPSAQGPAAVGVPLPTTGQGMGYSPISFLPWLEAPAGAGAGTAVLNGAMLGREVPLVDLAGYQRAVVPLAATTRRGGDGTVWLRVAWLERPMNANLPIDLAVSEGRADDFLATRKVLGFYRVPDGTGAISTACFSASGERMVFSHNVPEQYRGDHSLYLGGDKENGTSCGESLRFIEFAAGAFKTLKESSLSVTVNYSKTSEDAFWRNDFDKSCVGSYELFASYIYESVVYTRAVVDCTAKSSYQKVYGGDEMIKMQSRLHGVLIFPDSTEIVYCDATSQVEFSAKNHVPVGIASAGTMKAKFKRFLHIDPGRPHGCAFIDCDADGAACLPQSMSMKVCFGERVLLEKGRFDIQSTPANDSAAFRGAYQGLFSAFPSFTPWVREWGRYEDEPRYRSEGTVCGCVPVQCLTTHKAILIGAAGSEVGVLRGINALGGGSEVAGSEGDVVGPILHSPTGNETQYWNPDTDPGAASGPIYFQHNDLRIAHHLSETIAAGRVQNPLKVFPKRSRWEGDEGRFLYSTLDLQSLTGIYGLSKNIMPMGVLS